jgi:hypothetical protein
LREKGKLNVSLNLAPTKTILNTKEDGVGKWRKLHIEELRDFYASTTIIRVIKSTRMKQEGQGMWSQWETRERHTEFWSGNHLEGVQVAEMKML